METSTSVSRGLSSLRAGDQYEASTAEVLEAESSLTTSLSLSLLEILRSILPALTLFFVCHIVYSFTALTSDTAPLLALVSVLCVGGCNWMWYHISTAFVPPHSASPLLAIAAWLVIVQSLAYGAFASEPYHGLVIVLVLIALTYTPLSPKWLLRVHGTAAVGWGVVSAIAFPNLTWIALTLMIGASAVLSHREHGKRMEQRRLENLKRIQQEARRVAQDEDRRQKEERDQLAIEASNDGYWYWDLKTDKIHFSHHWAAMLGYREEELENTPEEWFKRVHTYYLAELKAALSQHLYGKSERFQYEYRIQHRDGTYLWVMTRGIAIRDAEGNPVSMAGSQVDITQLVEVEKSIVDGAFLDKLTGLPNRSALLVRLQRADDRLKTSGAYLFAVMFLDLDRFKTVNDSLGHLVGDQLIAAVAARLKQCVRERMGDMVARFGGDEFVVLMEDLRAADEAIEVAKRLRDALTAPFRLGQIEVTTATSIGIAFSTSKVDRAEDLLRNADTAMYHAKAEGRGRIQVFNAQMYSAAVRLIQLENDLIKALDREEMVLYYQPFISLKTGEIIGAEALLRWNHPSGDMIGPSEFIPIAEETGLIAGIGEWVLRTACIQCAAWQKAGLPPLKLAVNVSAHQLKEKAFPAVVARCVQESGVDPRWIELEITESALMRNLDAAATAMNELKLGGVQIAIDDFGTGYSSLGYLRRFPFDLLKIDSSFVAGLTTDKKSRAVARGLISLAHNLNLFVTAEGVSSEDQLSFLRDEDCDYFQGYLASMPLSPPRFEDLLRSRFNVYRHIKGQSVASKGRVPGETEQVAGRNEDSPHLLA